MAVDHGVIRAATASGSEGIAVEGLVQSGEVVHGVVVHVILGQGTGAVVAFREGDGGGGFRDLVFVDGHFPASQATEVGHSFAADEVPVEVVEPVEEVGSGAGFGGSGASAGGSVGGRFGPKVGRALQDSDVRVVGEERGAPAVGLDAGREIAAVLAGIHLEGEAQLPFLADAGDAAGRLLGASQGGEEHGCQDADDADHHEQFDQGEPVGGAGSGESGVHGWLATCPLDTPRRIRVSGVLPKVGPWSAMRNGMGCGGCERRAGEARSFKRREGRTNLGRMKPFPRWLYPVAVACLFFSGVAGLVYQVVWARYLALFLGHTSYAVVAVLVAFMGGLALGNAMIGRWADRVGRPLALYGWLEVGIAVYAVLFPTYHELCQRGYLAAARGADPGSPGLLILKFAFSFAAILVPTVLMGGTLPVLTRLVTRSLGELRARVAGLYFINSLGAVAGVLVADFWWVPGWGLGPALVGGAVLNLGVGVLALVTSCRWEAGLPVELSAEEASGRGGGEERGLEEVEERYGGGELRLAVAAAGVSGFVAMLYEVVWTRILALVLGSSTHAFSLMLVTFIAGIATGAWWVGRWRGLRRTFDAFGWAELALALVLMASMGFYHLLPYGFARLGAVFSRLPEHHGVYQGAQFLICFAVMFGPATCLGMTLPLASRVATSELARTGRSVGLVFSVNTLGTVLGAGLTGLVLLPWLGLARTFALGIGLNLVVAVAVLVRRWRGVQRLVWVGALPVLLVWVVLVQGALGRTWEKAFSLGLWRAKTLPADLAAYRRMVEAFDVRFHRDGAGSTVAVTGWRDPGSGRDELTLRVNGKADATSRGDLPTQLLLAHLPLLMHPAPDEVLVVGLGSGMTVASALTHPDVRRVDAVEISPEVREAAREQFGSLNRGALDDSRVRVVLDDAKSFMKTSGGTYDVIISEPSNPWMAGVAGVFSREFYRTCRGSLKQGGLMVQWVHVYESSNEALQIVLATFATVFPHFSLWQTLPGDLVLVGSVEPRPADLEGMQRRFSMPSVTADLRRIDVYALAVVLGLQVVSEGNGAFLVEPGTPIHSDTRPVLEYVAERGFFAREEANLPDVFDEHLSRRPATLLGEHARRFPLNVAEAQSFALLHATHRMPKPRMLRSILERWRELAPGSTLPAEFSAKMEYPLPVAELEASRMARVRDTMLENPAAEMEPLRIYSRHLMNAYRQQRSVFYQPPTEDLIQVLERLAEVDSVHRQTHWLRLAELAWDRGDDARFMELAERAFRQEAGAPPVGRFDLDRIAPGNVLGLVLETLWRAGRREEARQWSAAARSGGYLIPGSAYYTPVLAMIARKVDAGGVPPNPESEERREAKGSARGGG